MLAGFIAAVAGTPEIPARAGGAIRVDGAAAVTTIPGSGMVRTGSLIGLVSRFMTGLSGFAVS